MMKNPGFSRLYDCEVMHSRNSPTRHAFKYRYFSFCIDLDEVEQLSTRSRFFGLQFWKIFRFVTKDYIFGSRCKTPKEVKDAVIAYARHKGESRSIDRVELIAHMRTFGYSFNPAAFYFCYSKDNSVVCSILEITNTFKEKKAYFIPAQSQDSVSLQGCEPKLFYVSPFVELDSIFEFDLEAPTNRLRLGITSTRNGSEIVRAFLQGGSADFSDRNLFVRLIKYHWVTVAVIIRIHYQAARLYFKKVPFIRKKERPELQKAGLL